ncbi:hypothetical protein ONE63_010877 [Megalurothrips usitatus]|uniref:Uncharacterized protein n=1 Tax=Megalurothrips usitatus TaxID=439358 RepID=A0AAV7XIE4_9NEOP|nr:hypothetical protein ONE63_010877 [Megalurothrips usitatus]
MSHRAEEEQLFRQSREVQFIRAATARSPTAPPAALRPRGSVSSTPATPAGHPAGEDLLLSVLQYPVTAAAGGGTGYQHRAVTTRSPGAPPPYYPSPQPSHREYGDGDGDAAPGSGALAAPPPPSSLALGTLGHGSDGDDTDGGDVSDPEHLGNPSRGAQGGGGGFSLHNFGAAMLRTIRNVRSSSPRFGEPHHPHYGHAYPTPVGGRRRRDARAAYRRANSREEDACSDILGEDDDGDSLGGVGATVLDVGDGPSASDPLDVVGHGDRHRGSVNSTSGTVGTGKCAARRKEVKKKISSATAADWPSGGGGGRGRKRVGRGGGVSSRCALSSAGSRWCGGVKSDSRRKEPRAGGASAERGGGITTAAEVA